MVIAGIIVGGKYVVSLLLLGVNDVRYCSQRDKSRINGSEPIWVKGTGMLMYLATL